MMPSPKPCGSCLKMINFGGFGAPQVRKYPILVQRSIWKLENVNDSKVRSCFCPRQYATPTNIEQIWLFILRYLRYVETILKWKLLCLSCLFQPQQRILFERSEQYWYYLICHLILLVSSGWWPLLMLVEAMEIGNVFLGLHLGSIRRWVCGFSTWKKKYEKKDEKNISHVLLDVWNGFLNSKPLHIVYTWNIDRCVTSMMIMFFGSHMNLLGLRL